MVKIMVAEDDRHTAMLMQAVLVRAGYEVFLVGDGYEALALLDKQQIDLIVLDIMMPRMDGYELTEQLRDCNINIPILMVTAKQLPEERCRGFLVGTDDYMVKPVNEEEMLLRIRALLRRSRIANEHKLRIGKNILLDYDSLTVTRAGQSQTLPQKEFYLLYKLLAYPGKIFTRLQLMDEIWGMDTETQDSTITVHINRLRKRFEGWPEFQLIAIRGIGYKAVIERDA